MGHEAAQPAEKFKAYTSRDIDAIPQLRALSEDHRLSLKAVAAVLPFRVNAYVLDQLIDWDAVPDDPIYQLTIPQPGMLAARDLADVRDLIQRGEPRARVNEAARRIQMRLNPHPAGQVELNVPRLDGAPVRGLQHKYRQTVLFFPSAGQTCHSYCTYCFRWAQFVGAPDLRFAAREADSLARYLRLHPEVSDVLFTGGDPMVMRTVVLQRYLEPLLQDDLPHLSSIRFGTKAPAYWPQRFTSDPDADALLRLIEALTARGKHVAFMAHFSHPRELSTKAAMDALRRLRSAGATIRCQAPLIRHVNDDADSWAQMWRAQVALGAIPYYMFVERDTGPKDYFGVPLYRALRIFREAYTQVSGLARTVRGPSMSTTPGKVVVDGTSELNGRPVFVLRFLQARTPDWVGRPFFAKYCERAIWLDQLEPLDGREFFFEPELARMVAERRQRTQARLPTLAS